MLVHMKVLATKPETAALLQEMRMYQLHIANKNYSSWSLRPWVLLRGLQIPFDEVIHPFSDTGNREAFRRFSPTAQVPCLVDGQRLQGGLR